MYNRMDYMVEVFILACLKCGRELAEGQSFCEECRQGMAQYPVKPDTPVCIIPRPKEPTEKKTPRKDKQADKALHAHLRSAIRWLIFTVGVLTIIVCLLAGLLFEKLGEPADPNVIGRNYTVITERN